MSSPASSTTRRAGFTVRGVHFDSPAAARAAARSVRDDAEDYARSMRAQGQDARADELADKANDLAAAYETAAAEHDTRRGQTPRRRTPRAGQAAQGARRRGGTGNGGSTTAGATAKDSLRTAGQLAGGATSGLSRAAGGGWGDLFGLVLWGTIGAALLALVIATPRGPAAWSWLTGALAGLVGVISGPGDPLAGVGGLPGSSSSGTATVQRAHKLSHHIAAAAAGGTGRKH